MAVRMADLLLAGDTEAFHRAVDDAGLADVAEVLTMVGHHDPNVRQAIVQALPLLTHGDPPTREMVGVALRMTRDEDREVRNWACFALGQQWREEVDTAEVRDALAARLDDIDRDTRHEALRGLAYRHDPRALERVRMALSRPSGDVWLMEMLAAGALSDPQLHELVLRHQSGWRDPESARTAELVRRLTDPDGPGDDVIDGVAALYRRRAHGWPDGDGLAAWHVMLDLLDIAPKRAREFLDAVVRRLDGDAAAVQDVRERSALAVEAANGD